ncbi:hypothetical protein FRB94_001051 [Tulasnella sp. JGI-2019a]|nr:hypothetical protein FRB94_001051 [Tulasnella sp. JGI-2019a]
MGLDNPVDVASLRDEAEVAHILETLERATQVPNEVDPNHENWSFIQDHGLGVDDAQHDDVMERVLASARGHRGWSRAWFKKHTPLFNANGSLKKPATPYLPKTSRRPADGMLLEFSPDQPMRKASSNRDANGKSTTDVGIGHLQHTTGTQPLPNPAATEHNQEVSRKPLFTDQPLRARLEPKDHGHITHSINSNPFTSSSQGNLHRKPSSMVALPIFPAPGPMPFKVAPVTKEARLDKFTDYSEQLQKTGTVIEKNRKLKGPEWKNGRHIIELKKARIAQELQKDSRGMF